MPRSCLRTELYAAEYVIETWERRLRRGGGGCHPDVQALGETTTGGEVKVPSAEPPSPSTPLPSQAEAFPLVFWATCWRPRGGAPPDSPARAQLRERPAGIVIVLLSAPPTLNNNIRRSPHPPLLPYSTPLQRSELHLLTPPTPGAQWFRIINLALLLHFHVFPSFQSLCLGPCDKQRQGNYLPNLCESCFMLSRCRHAFFFFRED